MKCSIQTAAQTRTKLHILATILTFYPSTLLLLTLLGPGAELLVADEVLQLLVALVLVRHRLDVRVLRHGAAVHAAEVTVKKRRKGEEEKKRMRDG